MRCAPAAAAYSDATELDLDFSLQGRRRRSCRSIQPAFLLRIPPPFARIGRSEDI